MTEDTFARTVETTLRDMLKLKTVMLKKDLTAAKARCPECGGWLQGRLVGRRQHMRLWCEGSCKRSALE